MIIFQQIHSDAKLAGVGNCLVFQPEILKPAACTDVSGSTLATTEISSSGRLGPKIITRSKTRRPDVRFLEKKTGPAQRLIGLGYLLMLCLPLLM